MTALHLPKLLAAQLTGLYFVLVRKERPSAAKVLVQEMDPLIHLSHL